MTVTRCSTWVKLVLIAIVAGFAISDFVLDHDYTEGSNKWSASTQKSGGSGVETISNLLSTVAVYWVLLMFHFYVVFTKEVPYMIFTIMQYFLGLTITLILKALYYRGRPFVIAADVQGCQCDPGMPSGHATMAVLTYWILYDQVDRAWIETFEPASRRRNYRLLMGILCCIVGAGVMFSRVALGVHTWSQLLIGAAVGLFVITFFTYELWCQLLTKMIPKLAAWMWGYTVGVLAVAILMLFINHEYRERPNYWAYFSKCTDCLGSFVYGQSQSLGLTFFQMGFLLGFPMKDGTTVGIQRSVLTTDQKVKRYFIYLCLMVPAILVVGIFEFVVRSKMKSSRTSITVQSILGLLVYGICTFYLGFATSSLRVWVFKKFDWNRDDLDLLYKDDLLAKQERSEEMFHLGHEANPRSASVPQNPPAHKQIAPETGTNQISFVAKGEDRSTIG